MGILRVFCEDICMWVSIVLAFLREDSVKHLYFCDESVKIL